MLAPTAYQTKPKMHDLSDHFEHSRLFSCLTDLQVDQISKISSIRQLPSKAPLTPQSNDSNTVQFLLKGRAKVCYLTRDGKQPILYFVDPSELVGEQSILTGSSGDLYAETMEPSTVADIPTSALRNLMLGEPDFAIGLAELISRRRVRVEGRLRSLLFLSNRERLTHLLLDIAEQYGTGSATHLELNIKLSHQDLANFIGSTRETVTVVLGKMQADGLLHIKRRRIVLLDVNTLSTSVDRSIRLPAESRFPA